MPETKEKIIPEALPRFSECEECDRDEREKGVNDLKFLDGENQWDEAVKDSRKADGRPCLTINKQPTLVDRAIGELRQNKLSIKVLPADKFADEDTADAFEGLIRNIEVNSQAPNAYMNAAEGAAECGRGFFRIMTKWSSDDTFEQDIVIEPILNPFTVYFPGNLRTFDFAQAEYLFVTEWVTEEEHRLRYPGKEFAEFPSTSDGDQKLWRQDKKIRIAEYWRVIKKEKTLYLWINDTVSFEPPPDGQVKRERKVKVPTVEWYKINSKDILEGPTQWAGRYIPIVPIWGKEINIEGQRRTRGIVRHSHGSQQMVNYYASAEAETIALTPKAPWLVTEKQIEGYEHIWGTANQRPLPYLPYKYDPNATGPPQRVQPTQMNAAITQARIQANQDLQDTAGSSEAYLGRRSNEKSGVAVENRAEQSSIGNFTITDNAVRGITYAGIILVDLIPKIFDTERMLRILGPDMAPKFIKVNAVQDPETGKLIDSETGLPAENALGDISIGKYDIVVTVGPSFKTQKQEAAENILRLMEVYPDAAPIIADLFASNLDFPGKEEISERLKKMVPPQLLSTDEQEQEGGIPQEAEQQEDPEMEMNIVKIAQERAKLDGILLDNEIKKKELATPTEPKQSGKGNSAPRE